MNPVNNAQLNELGWNDHFASAFDNLYDPLLRPARVAADFGSRFLTLPARSNQLAMLGRTLKETGRPVAVGDWVGVRHLGDATEIRHVLPRTSALRRKVPGWESLEQVLAANVDLVFIATAVGPDVNPRRIERLLTVAYESGAAPVVLLMKADLADTGPYEVEVQTLAPGVPIIPVSGLDGRGSEGIMQHLSSGKTAVLVGSSGVGKSTLINRLLGADRLRTAEVHNHSGQGRHTTSHRELLTVPGGGLIIDTPGLREVQLWAGADAVDRVFAEIEALANRCRFADCRHEPEPGCAVAAALADGTLDAGRFANYRKLLGELRAIEVRADVRLQIEARRRWKMIDRSMRKHPKLNR